MAKLIIWIDDIAIPYSEAIWSMDVEIVGYILKNDKVHEKYNTNLCIDETELSTKYFDYLIVFALNGEGFHKVQIQLNELNITNDRILNFLDYEKNPRALPVHDFYLNNLNFYNGYILGMSHSYGGLLETLLKLNFYKFSAPSMDLYYHYLILKDLHTNNCLHNIKALAIEVPYYIFNYDISKANEVFKERINFYFYFKDFHHFGETIEQNEYIEKFIKLNELCKIKYPQKGNISLRSPKKVFKLKFCIRKWYKNLRIITHTKKKAIWSDIDKNKILSSQPHVWYKIHQETIDENIVIMKKIMSLIKEYPNITLKFVVFPQNPIFFNFHKIKIEEMRSTFYRIANELELPVLDFFYEYNEQPEYFVDDCHLNNFGSYCFSRKLRKIFR